MKPVSADACNVKKFLCQEQLLFGLYITFQVMAVAEMSPSHQNAVTSLSERLYDEDGINASGTHDAHRSQVGWVLQP